MKTSMRALLVAAALSCAALQYGCASTPPTATELAKADYGPAPKDAERIVKAYFQEILRDPYTAVYGEITTPEKGSITNSMVDGGGHNFGWMVLAKINAKNAYGGYTGMKTYTFIIRDEKITKVITPEQ